MIDDLNFLLNNNEPDKFLELSSELPNDFWEDYDNMNLLVKSIHINHLGLRDYIFRVILNISDRNKSAAADLVVPFLYENDKEVRNLASDLLIKLGVYSNSSLLPILKDPDIDVRKFGSDILGLTGTDNEIPFLIDLLNDEDMNVFNSAIESIGSIFDRNKDKIGLADSMVDVLINIYYNGNPDTKPTIIEAISKIGGNQAVDFLVDLLAKEDDLFLKTTVIDSLAICGNSTELCMLLRNEIHNYIPELQPIILKTLVAIAYRTGCELDFGQDFRNIAYLALEDSDPDTRTAGLLSLGSHYQPEDIKLVANEYMLSSEELKYYIINNIITYNIDLYDMFMQHFFEKADANDNCFTLLEMFSLVQNFFEEIEESVQESMITTTINYLEHQLKFSEYQSFESLRLLNPELFDRILDLMIAEQKSELFNELTELKNYLLNH